MNEERVKELVKAALPPVRETEPRRDLWPAMSQRIDERTVRFPVFDAALIAAVVVWIVIDPLGALALLYHL
jgi:hypothetical protein